MGFALWIEDNIAVAQGVHEYRPMGVAVISITDLFRPRDFHSTPNPPSRLAPTFAGLFASVHDMNRFLARRSQAAQKSVPRMLSLAPPWI
jgi:hypothetical protein